MASGSWDNIDFVALGVNVVAGLVLVGGLVGAIAVAPSGPDASPAAAPEDVGPPPPPEDDCGRRCGDDDDEDDDDDDDDREDRRGRGKRDRD